MSQPATVIVTGASWGIGQGIIRLLAKSQYRRPLCIYATSRSGVDLDVQPLSPNQIRHANLDISGKSSIMEFINSTLQRDSRTDVLVNNAGVNNNNK